VSVSDGAALTPGGRAFLVRAADTGNALSPSVEQRVAGMTSVINGYRGAKTSSSIHSTGQLQRRYFKLDYYTGNFWFRVPVKSSHAQLAAGIGTSLRPTFVEVGPTV